MTNPDEIAIIVVTYKRQELLEILLDSITKMNIKPGRVYIVDNENSDATKKIVDRFQKNQPRLKSKTSTETLNFKYIANEKNTGGAGGFYTGTRAAYEDGYKWFWLIDDDVKVLPLALDILLPRMENHSMIQGQRMDYDMSTFYWQYRFSEKLGIPNPLSSPSLAPGEARPMNTACFEGTIFNRKIVDKIGFPDPRFFIYWDDTIYGYLATHYTQPVYVEGLILQRTREVKNLDLGIRHLRSTSDIVRYHMMKNRGYMANYYKLFGDYNHILFSFGTFLTFVKEAIRIFTVDKTPSTSFAALIEGYMRSKEIMKSDWKPSIWYKNNAEEYDDLDQMT
ncbi:MAG: glycosyltransferase [Bifidobacteriaceae bacterium]|jgi:glycosyltransferase involved in cell wall biosynthesis|nr:glycosyltransferase [Bifidobacteriaceae bacterium]